MPRTELTPKSGSDIDHRKAILSLRWLLVILASYLTLFSYVGTELFPFVFGFALAFSASNFALMLIPRTQFLTRRARALISVLDFFFVSATLYLLRVPEDYLYVTFAAIFILALIWRYLRVVLHRLASAPSVGSGRVFDRTRRFQDRIRESCRETSQP